MRRILLFVDRPMVFHDDASGMIEAKTPTHLVLIGGEPRHIFWNFVSSAEERIKAAKRQCKERRFPKVPGDEVEFTPLPER